jgi:cytoskeletal protein CcmA (bactofilin family)
MDNKPPTTNPVNDSLEQAETVVQNQPTVAPTESNVDSLDGTKNTTVIEDAPRAKPKKSLSQRVQQMVSSVNIYFLLFVLVLLMAAIAAFASYQSSKKIASQDVVNGQNLSAQDLQNLKNNDTTVGDPKQTLTVASNAIFNGRVLVRDSLDVAGTLRVGGALSLPGITVSGTSAFENVQVANNLSVSGNESIQGTLTIQQNLSVGGTATFAGSITAPSLSIDQLIMNKDIQLNRHIDAGGPTPKVTSGTAVGNTGTVSISGTDTAGTVNINFGSSPVAGIIANITFGNNFSQTPHVVITPVGSNCAALTYYVSRTAAGFSIGTANGGPASSSCAFDFIAID